MNHSTLDTRHFSSPFPAPTKTTSRLTAPVNVPLLSNGTSHSSGGALNGTAPRRLAASKQSEDGPLDLVPPSPPLGERDQGRGGNSPLRISVTAEGFELDGTWDLPGLGPHLQYTKRSGPTHPAYGATFYVPADATIETITRRAREVAASFQEA